MYLLSAPADVLHIALLVHFHLKFSLILPSINIFVLRCFERQADDAIIDFLLSNAEVLPALLKRSFLFAFLKTPINDTSSNSKVTILTIFLKP